LRLLKLQLEKKEKKGAWQTKWDLEMSGAIQPAQTTPPPPQSRCGSGLFGDHQYEIPNMSGGVDASAHNGMWLAAPLIQPLPSVVTYACK
jgi:hypothetical protein